MIPINLFQLARNASENQSQTYQPNQLLHQSIPQRICPACSLAELNLQLKTFSQNIDLDYRNDVSAFYYQTRIGNLKLVANDIDLPHRKVSLNSLTVDQTSTALRLGNDPDAKKVVKQVKQDISSQAEMDWHIRIGNLALNNNTIQFDDDTKVKQSSGMDYAHLLAKNVTIHADDLRYNKDHFC